jgi:hypothetical protein
MVHLIGMGVPVSDDGLYFTISWSEVTGNAIS